MLILALVFMGDSDRAAAAYTPTNKAVVAVAFIGSFNNSPTAASYQRISLNVVSIRLNPKPNSSSLSDFDPGWITIGVPAGVGKSFGISEVNTGSNFGGYFTGSNTNVAIGEGRSEIQIDLNAIQNIAEIFNAQAIAAKTYQTVELILDTVTPGNVVPLCPTGAAGEGCIDYRAKLPQITPTPAMPLSIRASMNLNLSKSQNVVTPIVIQVDPGIGAPPSISNQTIQILPTISVISNSSTTAPFTNPALATLIGTITTNATGGFTRAKLQSISALNAGTGNIVETITLPTSCYTKKTCDYTMYLPAVAAITNPSDPGFPGGTNYDLVATAKGTSYAVRSSVNVVSGTTTDIRPNPNTGLPPPLKVVAKGAYNFTGRIFDLCAAGVGVPAATINILVPDPTISPTPDCTANPPVGCVVAATAATDEIGGFPMPGNGFQKAPFNLVPLPDIGASYEMVVTAAGFDRTEVNLTTVASLIKCANSTKKGTCQVNLSHGIMTGNVALGDGGTGPVSVFVAAEDSGTNNIENLQLVNIPGGLTTVPFTMNVPDNQNSAAGGGVVSNLDLFASAQDLFNGSPQKATGHTIAVLAGVGAPPPPSGGPPAACATVPNVNFSGMSCFGHGSVDGQVNNPVSTDTVVLSKDGVQLESVPIVPPGSAAAGTFSLCAPADPSQPYDLTHFAQGTLGPSPVGTPVPVTIAFPVMIPTPAPSPGFVPTPCPGICQVSPPSPNSGCLTCQASTSVNGF
jgi:hypothetical protein